MYRPHLATAVRLVGIVALVIGMLAMHGMSTGRDPASMGAQMSMSGPTDMPAPAHGHLGHLGAVCVAVLTGGLGFLLLLALRRRGEMVLHAVPPRLAGVARRPVRAAPPPRPSLTTLCLSRT